MDDGIRSDLDPGTLIEALPGRVAVQFSAEFVHVSDGFAEAIGEDADALRGVPWQDVFDRRTVSGLEAGVSGALSGCERRCTFELAEGEWVELALSGTEGGAVVWTIEPMDGADAREVVEGAKGANPGSTFAPNREPGREVTNTDRPEKVLDGLTDRQHEVLEAAFRAGYYDWPRESTAEELATSLGLTGATLHGHLRKAERTVLAWLLGPGDGPR